jgi:hypothetical protein
MVGDVLMIVSRQQKVMTKERIVWESRLGTSEKSNSTC